MRKPFVLTTALLVPMLLPAVPVTFTGSDGGRSASAIFDTSGSNLVVTLTNTATADALIQTHILTGVFFNFANVASPALTTVSAVLGNGSVVNFNGGATGAGGSVGGEWAYKGGISAHGQDRGISSAALGVFGPGDVFPGSANLQGPASPNGIQYGITTAGDDPATGNGGVSGQGLIKNSVVFTLSGLSPGFDPNASISSVIFQYGADLADPIVTGIRPSSVPEPTSVLLLGTLISFIGWKYKRKSTQS